MISQCPSLAYAYACIPTGWSFVEKTSVMQSRCTSRKQIVSNFYVFHRGRGEVETDFALPWNRKLRFASLSLFFVAWGGGGGGGGCLNALYFITAWKRSLRRLCLYTCLSFCSQRECLPQCMLGYTPLVADTPLEQTAPRKQTPPCTVHCWEIRATSGRYASYWNAYLFILMYWCQRLMNIARLPWGLLVIHSVVHVLFRKFIAIFEQKYYPSVKAPL